MANLNNITPMKGLPPFLQYFRTIGIIPASYKVTMTFEEQVLELMRFIKDEIIPKINENVLATQELQEKFKELVTYVDEYFENLDIQEEINNKLNEMADSGQLTEIIAQYLQLAGVLAYNNINDLKNATNIVAGSICKTLGKNSYNDGLGNFYKVREIINTDIIDDYNIIALNDINLVAERIENWKKVQYFKINNYMSEEEIKKIIEINDFAKVIEFENAVYNFNSPLHLKSNTKFILNGSTLNFNFSNNSNVMIFGYEPNSEYTEYNGKSNIEFINGTIKTGIALMHNTNIKFINIVFDKSTGHAIQLGGCKNIEINGCIFNPSLECNNIEQNEIIQLEFCTRAGQPWLDDENSPSYDGTTNENILIKNCTFKNGDNINTFAYTAIGNHSPHTEEDVFVTNNLTIENCTFKDGIYGGISGFSFSNINILNNIFDETYCQNTFANIRLRGINKNIKIKDNTFIEGNFAYINVNVKQIENIIIENNDIDISTDNSIALEFQGIKNASIINNKIKAKHYGLYFSGASATQVDNIIIQNNFFDMVATTDAGIKLYNGTNVNIINNRVKQNNDTLPFIEPEQNVVVFAKDNYLTTENNSRPRLVPLTGINYNHIYNSPIPCYTGAGTYSALTNETPIVPFNNFSRLKLLIHKSGDSQVMDYVIVTGYQVDGKVDARIHGLCLIINNDIHYATFKINNDGTFNFSSDGQITLRTIYGYNE